MKTLLIIIMVPLCIQAQFNFTASYTTGSNSANNPFAYNGTNYSGITPGNLSKQGVSNSTNIHDYRGTDWPGGATDGSNTFSGSINMSKYLDVTFVPNTGYKMTIISINFGIARSSTGPRQFEWRGSHDGYASAINNYTALSGSLTNASGVVTFTNDVASSLTGNILNIQSNYTDITSSANFRLYMYNSEGASGSGGLNSSSASCLTITGVFECIHQALTSTSKTGLTEQCRDTWTFYGDASGVYFGIKKNGNSLNATVDLASGAVISKVSSFGLNNEHGMFLLGSYWDVKLISGSISSPVDVRFFYHPDSINAAKTARNNSLATLPASTKAVSSGNTAEWFKNANGAPFNASYIAGIVGNIFPSAYQKFSGANLVLGSQNGIQYAELKGVTSFSGGTAGFSYGPPNSGGLNALPVKWAEFEAKSTEWGNELVWTTASEYNTDHFEIDYSLDGVSFETLHEHIPAAGTSTSLRSYSFSHKNFTMSAYYRIKQVDQDNQFEYSKIIYADRMNKEAFDAEVFPNPIPENNIFTISANTSTNHLTVKIVDIHGRILGSYLLEAKNNRVYETISSTNLPIGIYTILISDGKNGLQRRLVK